MSQTYSEDLGDIDEEEAGNFLRAAEDGDEVEKLPILATPHCAHSVDVRFVPSADQMRISRRASGSSWSVPNFSISRTKLATLRSIWR